MTPLSPPPAPWITSWAYRHILLLAWDHTFGGCSIQPPIHSLFTHQLWPWVRNSKTNESWSLQLLVEGLDTSGRPDNHCLFPKKWKPWHHQALSCPNRKRSRRQEPCFWSSGSTKKTPRSGPLPNLWLETSSSLAVHECACVRTLFILALLAIYKLKQITVETFASVEKGVYKAGENRLNRLRWPTISNTAWTDCTTTEGAKGDESASL